MSDRFAGQIKLGGHIVINTIEERELVQIALDLFANSTSHEWGGPNWDDMGIEDVPNHLDEDGYLFGMDDHALYGCFEELEDACREAGISYWRHSSARYEYDSEISEWRPGMESPFTQFSNEEAKILVPESTIETAIALMKEGRSSEVIKMLERETGKHIPKLEPLKITDNAPRE